MGKQEKKMVLLIRHNAKFKHHFDIDKEFGKTKKRPVEGLRLKEGFYYI